jgi:hypothetical protein
MNLEYSRQIFERFSNIKFHENTILAILRKPLKITAVWDTAPCKLADVYGVMWRVWGRAEVCTGFWLGNLRKETIGETQM